MSIPILKIPIEGFIKKGDTIPKIRISFSDDYIGNFETSTIKMQVYNGNEKIIDVSNGNGITVIDSSTLDIDKIQSNDFPIGNFKGDFEVTESNGDKTTYFNIEYTVIKQYTV
tara:strand:+ start:4282 stop:4620 length:339 start_codon:yes stop_codon:yes gene_type:complete